MEKLKEIFIEASIKNSHDEMYEEAVVCACAEKTEEVMKELLEWANDWRQIKKGQWINTLAPRPYITTAELVDKFLNQPGK